MVTSAAAGECTRAALLDQLALARHNVRQLEIQLQQLHDYDDQHQITTPTTPTSPRPSLSSADYERYGRQMMLKSIGLRGENIQR